ncbi:ATP-binding cassette sub-family B member 5 [Colletotrichum simmondsii]|uniref:ATP-binding cassette sub-family B member 5 n=1 Tax=Colletotrichum simmondsii TaxID=703756 RepID=A0A135SMZ9_9PEZI|nr:ATP-binding cassette sub-family B member 5 [Colletotrichum simmondsii]
MEKRKVSSRRENHDTSDDNQSESHSKPTNGLKGFFRIFRYGGPTDYVLEFVAIVAAIGSGVGLAVVNLVLGQFMDIISDYTAGAISSDEFMAGVSNLYFVYIGIVRFVLTYIYATIFTYVAFNITRNIRRAYLRSALGQEVSFFDHGTAGSISMQATSSGKLIQSGIAEKLGLVFQNLTTFLAAFIIAFVKQWKLTLIISCIMPALLITMGSVAIPDAMIDSKIFPIYAQAGTYAESILGSIRAVKAFSIESRIIEKYTTYLASARQLGNKKSPLYGVMFGGQYFVIYAGSGLAFWQGIAMVARKEVDGVGTVFTVLFSVIIASTTITAVAPHMVVFSRAATAASKLFALIDRESSIDPFSELGAKPEKVSGTIDIERVSFSYPTRPDAQVLKDFSLRVPAGKVTALVGTSGSGKSTVIGLLERWYDAQAGLIKLDGIDIRTLSLNWLRTNMRLVQQEPVLFNATVFDNIANGLVGTAWATATHEEQMSRVREAAKLAFADEFIVNLPDGYETRIGERGGLLSGGQKQRIAIARSIVAQPKILLLDEATSALDPHAEGIVQKALDSASKNRTTIVIAHKLATIRNADNIVVMNKGRIVEQGSHSDLVAAGGTYTKLVQAQNLSIDHNNQSDDGSDDESMQAIEATQTLAKYNTADAQVLASFKDRENFALHKQTGLFHTVVKLVMSTPEIKYWYLLAMGTCMLGAAVDPGQTLLLAKVMSAFTAPDMVQLYFVMGWATNVISQTLGQKIRQDLFRDILKQDLRFFDRPENTVGSLTSRIESNAQAVTELMGFNVALCLMALINVLASSILSIAVSWKLGLVGVFAGVPPLLLSGYARIRIETKMDADIDAKFSASASIASETVNAIRTISSLAIERSMLQRYTSELDDAVSNSTLPLFQLMIWFALTQSVEYFILGLGFWWGSKLVANGELTFSQFIISFMGLFFSGQAGATFFSYSSSFTKAKTAANYCFWLSKLVPTICENEETKGKGPANECQTIDFREVQFSYPLAPDNRVLKGVSLKIDPGQFVAFVGASGCGKSTMIALLQRFYDPTSGSIVIDDTDSLTDLSPRLYRSKLALVQQEPTLFPDTIRENIKAGIDFNSHKEVVANDSVIEAACRAANAWDFVSSLPEGLNTPCGHGGSQLSGGQRQRIAIARALVRNPDVILLDEATSALDTESEKVVQKALLEAAGTDNRITIAVAHRLSTIREADKICVFYGGRIVETGTHNALIELGGMYKKMCEAQSLDRAA